MLKATVDRATLKDALAALKKTRAKRATLPALSDALVTVADGDRYGDRLTITTTTLDAWTRVEIPATIHSIGGPTLAPFDTLEAAARSGPDAVEIIDAPDTEEHERYDAATGETRTETRWAGTLTVHGAARQTVATRDPDEYPKQPLELDTEPHPSDEIPADEWARLERIALAASTDDARPTLTAVCLEPDRTAVATDSYRMHWTTRPIPGPRRDDDHPPALIPAHIIKNAAQAARGAPIRLRIDAHHDDPRPYGATIETETIRGPRKRPRTFTVRIYTRTVEGQYPRWRDLTGEPDADAPALRTGAAMLAEAADNIAAAAGAANTGPVVRLERGDGNLIVPTLATSDTEATSHALTYDTPPNRAAYRELEHPVALNARYLRDAVTVATDGDPDGHRVDLVMRDELKPVHVLNSDATARALVMPVRV